MIVQIEKFIYFAKPMFLDSTLTVLNIDTVHRGEIS